MRRVEEVALLLCKLARSKVSPKGCIVVISVVVNWWAVCYIGSGVGGLVGRCIGV